MFRNFLKFYNEPKWNFFIENGLRLFDSFLSHLHLIFTKIQSKYETYKYLMDMFPAYLYSETYIRYILVIAVKFRF